VVLGGKKKKKKKNEDGQEMITKKGDNKLTLAKKELPVEAGIIIHMIKSVISIGDLGLDIRRLSRADNGRRGRK